MYDYIRITFYIYDHQLCYVSNAMYKLYLFNVPHSSRLRGTLNCERYRTRTIDYRLVYRGIRRDLGFLQLAHTHTFTFFFFLFCTFSLFFFFGLRGRNQYITLYMIRIIVLYSSTIVLVCARVLSRTSIYRTLCVTHCDCV